MEIHLHNTLTSKKEIFKPIKPSMVSFYQCGPTVYWTQHIGNMRAVIMADLINRTFQYLGYKVNFVRNYTDVGHLTSDSDEGEDKIEESAKREGLSPKEITEKYIKIFEEDIRALNNLEPTVKPKATENIDEILDMVQILLDKGFAYETELAIYFDITKARDYNRLSHQILAEQKQGAGSGEVSDSSKKNPADFALWFFKKGKHVNAIQTWDSPWGTGFPGWHIECSAFIRKFLGPTIDIHMGGIEHISIHHTNEIAQSEAVNNAPLAYYWLHNEHLLVDGKKMSKSEGTGYSLAEIKERGFDPMALRYFFLGAHYRSKQNFTWEALEAARNGLQNLREQIRKLATVSAFEARYAKPLESEKITQRCKDNDFKQKFLDAITDDFNIPKALAVLQELLKSNLADDIKLATALDFDKVLGLKLSEIKPENPSASGEIPKEIKELTQKRQKAREEKNWQESDKLRKQIEEMGFEIKDTEEGYEITYNNQ
ncbi:MAG: cysteine--tRNA ligase [Candidatus Zambryskibacteria bacterium]|nr:cysteine--tRNA ligase [Candidatus Zambryskibacteria bacterium]